MEGRHQRGFVTNELPIVFALGCVLGFLLLSIVARSLPWWWRVIGGIGLAFLGFGLLFASIGIIEARARTVRPLPTDSGLARSK